MRGAVQTERSDEGCCWMASWRAETVEHAGKLTRTVLARESDDEQGHVVVLIGGELPHSGNQVIPD